MLKLPASLIEDRKEDAPPTPKVVYAVTSYRWVVMSFFSGSLMTLPMITGSMSSISTEVAVAFDVPLFVVNLQSTVICLTYIPLTLFATWLFGKIRRDTAIRLGICIQLLGTWFRMLSYALNDAYWPIIGGVIIFTIC